MPPRVRICEGLWRGGYEDFGTFMTGFVGNRGLGNNMEALGTRIRVWGFVIKIWENGIWG